MNPNPYPPPGQPPPGQLPPLGTGLTVLAVIQIIFGAFGFCGPFGLFANKLTNDPFNRALAERMWEGALLVWNCFAIVLMIVSATLLLSTGIGILKRKRWAKKSGLAYGWLGIAVVVLSQIANFALIYPMMADIAAEHPGPIAQAGAMGGMVGGIFGALFGLILPIATLVVLTRPWVNDRLVA